MAGGRGERFWPKSRTNLPKQFLSLTSDGETMIQKTIKRLAPLVETEDIFVVTNAAYKQLVHEQLPQLPQENILAEPMARNTAPCIALAAAVIRKKYEDAVMLVLPSDHLIQYEEMYTDTLKQAIRVAEQGDNLVTIGITPTYPETGYGYIKFQRGGVICPAACTRWTALWKSRIWTPQRAILPPGSICGTAACSCGRSPPSPRISGS